MYQTLLCILLLFVGFQQTNAKEKVNADESSIRKTIASYTEAFNKGDAKAVAAHWSENGELITPNGKTLRGRTALTQSFEEYFKETKGVKIVVDVVEIRFLSPGVAVEKGVARILLPKKEPKETDDTAVPIKTDYTAVHVKTDQGWKMDRVQEEPHLESQTHYKQLKVLEWMVGTWVDSDKNATVEITCQWTKNKNFMVRSFKVYKKENITMEGTQVIGWDPIKKTIRSWMFDSAGGFGVGVWTQSENHWTVRTLQVLANGEKATSINIVTSIDKNRYDFRSVGREVDGELLPDIKDVKVFRK